MDFFFVEYRDPLVGLIILTILVFVVAVANYIWKIFANKDEEQKLEKFIKKCQNELKKLGFELSKSQLNLQTLIKIKQNLLIFFKDFKRLKLFNELTQAIYYHNECEIMHYEVLNDLEQNEKIKDFLTSQEKWWLQSFEY
ncbi:hypothetical protein ACMTE8_000178, partial [Campylobacter jejuni]